MVGSEGHLGREAGPLGPTGLLKGVPGDLGTKLSKSNLGLKPGVHPITHNAYRPLLRDMGPTDGSNLKYICVSLKLRASVTKFRPSA
jgi:hypothetical protein